MSTWLLTVSIFIQFIVLVDLNNLVRFIRIQGVTKVAKDRAFLKVLLVNIHLAGALCHRHCTRYRGCKNERVTKKIQFWNSHAREWFWVV